MKCWDELYIVIGINSCGCILITNSIELCLYNHYLIERCCFVSCRSLAVVQRYGVKKSPYVARERAKTTTVQYTLVGCNTGLYVRLESAKCQQWLTTTNYNCRHTDENYDVILHSILQYYTTLHFNLYVLQ